MCMYDRKRVTGQESANFQRIRASYESEQVTGQCTIFQRIGVRIANESEQVLAADVASGAAGGFQRALARHRNSNSGLKIQTQA
jgi:hypothetical protein